MDNTVESIGTYVDDECLVNRISNRMYDLDIARSRIIGLSYNNIDYNYELAYYFDILRITSIELEINCRALRDKIENG